MESYYSQQTIRSEKILNKIEQNNNPQYLQFSKQHTHRVNIPIFKNIRQKPDSFPSVSETQIVRHYYRLAKQNYSWEDGLYPLGSCTMKYNPLFQDYLAQNSKIKNIHPELPTKYTQGCLKIIFETQEILKNMLDIEKVSLLPAAGSQGELSGIKIANKYFTEKNEHRSKVLIPDSAHGTNPASAAMGGFDVEKIPSYENGLINIEKLQDMISKDAALLMLTNPNTLGIFEKDILRIQSLLAEKGILLYMDGANMNAIIGKISLKKSKIDIIQLNLHKTFSTPHGGGGPGQGAIGVSDRLIDFLPSPLVEYNTKQSLYYFTSPAKSIGKMKAHYGQFGLIIRAWAYLKSYGNTIETVAERAVLNSNYLKTQLKEILDLSTKLPTMHEVVFTEKSLRKLGISTINLAKALLDKGFYSPTIYFPLNVDGAIMIETTETETKEEIDYFVHAIKEIIQEAKENPNHIMESPHNTYVKQIDEVRAARQPKVRW